MPLTQEQCHKLFGLLEGKGWFWDQGVIHSPHQTYYLNGESPWIGDIVDFRNRMAGKLHRIVEHQSDFDKQIWQKIVEDISQLVNSLETICEDDGLESFFASIETPLYEFAKVHNLLVTKYHCGLPSWDFTFRHPVDGVGKIEVLKKSNNSITICLLWWVDDYDRVTRSTKSLELPEMQIASINLGDKLKECLQIILNWKRNELAQNHLEYRKAWSTFSKEDFGRLDNKYPKPRL